MLGIEVVCCERNAAVVEGADELLDTIAEPLQLSFHQLRYGVTLKRDGQPIKRQLLQGISAVFGDTVKGEMVRLLSAFGWTHIRVQIAVMGQSGAGKTTLLNALAQKLDGDLSGAFRINGRPAASETIRRCIGLVHQTVCIVLTAICCHIRLRTTCLRS